MRVAGVCVCVFGEGGEEHEKGAGSNACAC